MKNSAFKYTLLASVMLGLSSPLMAHAISSSSKSSLDPVADAKSNSVSQAMTGLTLPFIANTGQTDPSVGFYAQTFAGSVYVTRAGELVYSLPPKDGKPGWTLVEHFAQGKPHPVGIGANVSQVSYIKDTHGKAVTETAKTFGKLDLGEVFSGVKVELIAHGNTVEKVYTVAPRVNASNIRMTVAGSHALTLDTNGALLAETGHGSVQFSAPIAWQEKQGKKIPVKVSYALNANSYGFNLGDYDHSQPVIIDPLIQATYLGGNGAEKALDIKVHPKTGEVYVLVKAYHPGKGFTNRFPGTNGGWQSTQDITSSPIPLIARLKPDLKSLLQATYLFPVAERQPHPAKDRNSDAIIKLMLHPKNGDVYLYGYAPVQSVPGLSGGALPQAEMANAWFISRLSATLTQLKQSSFLSAKYSFTATPSDVVLDLSAGVNAAISPVNGTINLVGTDISKTQRAVVMQLNETLKTFKFKMIDSDSIGNGIAVHPKNGDIYIAGTANDDLLPNAVNGYQPYNNSFPSTGLKPDAFVAKFSPDLLTLKQATYLGGTSIDNGKELAFNKSGNSVYIAGDTYSANFPDMKRILPNIQAAAIWNFYVKLSSDLKTLQKTAFLPELDLSGQYFTAMYVHPVTDEVFVIDDKLVTGKPKNTLLSYLTPNLQILSNRQVLIDAALKHTGIAYTFAPTGNLYVVGNQENKAATTFPKTAGGYQATPQTAAGGLEDIFIARYAIDKIVPKADLKIAVTSTPSPVLVGANLTYTLTVKNNGPDTANLVKLTSDLPRNVSYKPAPTGCALVGWTVTCSVGTLAKGVQKSFVINVIPTTSGILTSKATVSGYVSDPKPSDNAVIVKTTAVLKK